ncbi:YbgA family protein [Evansella sp. AB-rgal1]|uniref:YbgA family protein n=1 Tax=Evansella sp. AB-rgal1 TaxID=3242696 RepID=UPI00359CD9A6
MKKWNKPIVVISKCLGFDACRFNGDKIHDSFIEKLSKYVTFITVCPEVEIGLGTPRKPIRIVSDGDEYKLIQPATNLDVTKDMLDFSSNFIKSLEEVHGFILKNRSPSCAISDAKIMSGLEKAPTIGKSAGFFGDAVLQKFSHLAIEDEGRLKNFTIREHFLTKLFTIARFSEIKKNYVYNDLLAFQTENKYLLMAYHQMKQKELGRIVANVEKKPVEELYTSYEKVLYELLSKEPSFQSHINVLQHIFGYFSNNISSDEKRFFLSLLEQYRENVVPLSSPLGVLKAWNARFSNSYLASQTYFMPYPEQLIEITDSGKGRNFA